VRLFKAHICRFYHKVNIKSTHCINVYNFYFHFLSKNNKNLTVFGRIFFIVYSLPVHNMQNIFEKINNVDIKVACRVDGIVQRLGIRLCQMPVISYI